MLDPRRRRGTTPRDASHDAELQSGLNNQPPWRLLFVLLTAVGFNALAGTYQWLPSGRLTGLFLPHGEAIFLLLVATYLVTKHGSPRSLWLRLGLLVWLLIAAVLMMYSTVEGFFEFFYGRHFAPRIDIGFLGNGAKMVLGLPEDRDRLSFAVSGTIILGAGLGIGWLCLVGLRAGLADPGSKRAVRWVLVVLLGYSVLFSSSDRPLVALMFSQLGVTTDRHPPGTAQASNGAAEPSQDRPTSAAAIRDQAGGQVLEPLDLTDHDIHLFFVESYGQTIFAQQNLMDELVPFLKDLERQLIAAGYSTQSSFLVAPVVGGYSWIAEAAFLTGQDIRNDEDYAAAIQEDGPTLPSILGEEGYITMISMPGTIYGDWPEAKTFYRFNEVMLAPDFDYAGPDFSFVPIPDQLAIDQAYSRLGEVRGEKRAYLQHVLVSSHLPYNRIPPYVADWTALNDGTIYHSLPVREFDNGWLSGSEYEEGYVAAIKYTLSVIAHFLTEIVEEQVLAILIGDHQPGPQIRHKDAPWSVPVHIIAASPSGEQSVGLEGFQTGMVPTRPLPHPPSYEFLDQFLPLVLGGTSENEQ